MVLPPCSTVSGHMWAKKFGLASIIPQQWRNLPWRAPSNGGWNNLGWVFYSRKQSFMIHMQHLLPVYIICNWYPAMKWMLPGVTLVYKILLLLLLFVALFWTSSFHMTQLVSEILTSISSVYAGDAVQLPGTTIFVIGFPFHYSVKDMGEWDGPECCHFFRTHSHDWRKWAYAVPIVDLCDVKSLSLVAFTWCKASWSASTFPLKKTWRSCWVWDC